MYLDFLITMRPKIFCRNLILLTLLYEKCIVNLKLSLDSGKYMSYEYDNKNSYVINRLTALCIQITLGGNNG